MDFKVTDTDMINISAINTNICRRHHPSLRRSITNVNDENTSRVSPYFCGSSLIREPVLLVILTGNIIFLKGVKWNLSCCLNI